MVKKMGNKEKDIRFYRTKTRILSAMIELLKIKSFEQITVKDICAKASVSRSAFYLHFLDKYDLVEKNQVELMAQVNQLIKENTFSTEEIMIKILYFFKEEGQLMGLLISDKGSVEIQNQVKKLLQQNAFNNIIPHIDFVLNNDLEKHYFVTFFSNAMLGLLQEWMNTGQKETPEELVQMLSKFIPYKFI